MCTLIRVRHINVWSPDTECAVIGHVLGDTNQHYSDATLRKMLCKSMKGVVEISREFREIIAKRTVNLPSIYVAPYMEWISQPTVIGAYENNDISSNNNDNLNSNNNNNLM